MPINLKTPLDDTVLDDDKRAFLKNLQANILKGHGRDHVALIFLKINDVKSARHYLRSFAVSNAFDQHRETQLYKETKEPGSVVRLVHVSAKGLTALGHLPKFDDANAFKNGMAADGPVLDGGKNETWQPELKKQIDVMLLVAYHDEKALARIVGKLVADLEVDNSGFEIRLVQEGLAYRNLHKDGLEHFGYVDGRSQPLMLKSQITKEEPITIYDPRAPLNQFLVPDPLSKNGFGSYFVFRKLEQNVGGFKAKEEDLSKEERKKHPKDHEELAGAQVVGRFEDGTPVTTASAPGGGPVLNDFDYSTDPAGARCPFQGHIRKTNPRRGMQPNGENSDLKVQMARRGITYGRRLQDPDSLEFIDKPNDGVGLLFMSYQASIENQFQFMQTQWANNESFPQAGVGIDPVIGQGGALSQTWPGPVTQFFHGFVTLKGGEYFYTPSITGLAHI